MSRRARTRRDKRAPQLPHQLALLPPLALLVLAGGFASGGHFKASRAASYWLMQAFRASLTWSAR